MARDTATPMVDITDLTAFEAGDPAAYLAAGTAAVRTYCEWHVTPEITETITVRGSGSRYLVLPSLKVTAVTAVTNGTIVYADDAGEYTTGPAGVLARVPAAGCWVRDGDVTLTITHGYADAADVQAVVLAYAARLRANPRSASTLAVGPFTEAHTIETASGFTAGEKEVLDRYRLASRP